MRYKNPSLFLYNIINIEQVAALDNLTGGATILVHTDGDTPAHLINRPENSFVDVYFTPKLLHTLGGQVQKSLDGIVDVFIANVQVPLVEHHRNLLDKNANIISRIANRNVVAMQRRAWSDMPTRVWGTPNIPPPLVAAAPISVVAAATQLSHLTTPICSPIKFSAPLADAKSSDEEWCEVGGASIAAANSAAPVQSSLTVAAALTSEPELLPCTPPSTEAVVDLCTSDESDTDVYVPLPLLSLQKFARPRPYIRLHNIAGVEKVGGITSASVSRTGSPTKSSATEGAVKSPVKVPRAAKVDSGNQSEPPTLLATTNLSHGGSRETSFMKSVSSQLALHSYGDFQPIVPPGPYSEQWLSKHQWPPRWANILRTVAEENSSGRWAEVLMEEYHVPEEAAEALKACIIDDFALHRANHLKAAQY